jgi:hypothetical protein
MANSGKGVSQPKGNNLGDTSGKFFDNPVNNQQKPQNFTLNKGKRGGTKQSKSISM